MFDNRKPACDILTLYDNGNPVNYHISAVKGYGGSSIVYEAERDNLSRCVIKEFAPSIFSEYTYNRKNEQLCYPEKVTSDIYFKSEKKKFIESCITMNTLAHSENTAEESLEAALLYGQYENPYIVMEWNPMMVVCCDEIGCISLNEAASLCLNLAETLIECHKIGIFHLDIKLPNILWSNKYKYVKLIDFGSAIKSDANQALRIADDVYAVGSVLFEKIFDRKINPIGCDRTSFAYEAEMDNLPLLAGESSKAVDLLKKILRNTICAAPGKRCDDNTMIEKLRELKSCTDESVVFLMGSFVPLPSTIPGMYIMNYFSELQHKMRSERIVVITASEPAGGKSELAKLYCASAAKEYHTRLWINCHEDIFSQIYFANSMLDDEWYEKHPDKCRSEKIKLLSACDRRTLIVLDGLDNYSFESIVPVFAGLNATVIITTRRQHTGILPRVHISPLNYNESMQLLYALRGKSSDNDENVYNRFLGNPLMLKLCAEGLPKNAFNIETFDIMSGGRVPLAEKIGMNKLNIVQKNCIKALSLISGEIDTNVFTEMSGAERKPCLRSPSWGGFNTTFKTKP